MHSGDRVRSNWGKRARRGSDLAKLAEGTLHRIQDAREAKEKFEGQTAISGERETTIRNVGRELADAQDQLQNAKNEIDALRSDLERIEA